MTGKSARHSQAIYGCSENFNRDLIILTGWVDHQLPDNWVNLYFLFLLQIIFGHTVYVHKLLSKENTSSTEHGNHQHTSANLKELWKGKMLDINDAVDDE